MSAGKGSFVHDVVVATEHDVAFLEAACGHLVDSARRAVQDGTHLLVTRLEGHHEQVAGQAVAPGIAAVAPARPAVAPVPDAPQGAGTLVGTGG